MLSQKPRPEGLRLRLANKRLTRGMESLTDPLLNVAMHLPRVKDQEGEELTKTRRLRRRRLRRRRQRKRGIGIRRRNIRSVQSSRVTVRVLTL